MVKLFNLLLRSLAESSNRSDEALYQARRQADWTKRGAIFAAIALILNSFALLVIILSHQATQQQADYARSAQRGWVTLAPRFSQPPNLMPDSNHRLKWSIPTNYYMKNIGKYPASSIITWSEIAWRLVRPLSIRPTPKDAAPDNTSAIAKDTCLSADSFSKTGSFTGFLFPDQDWNLSTGAVDGSRMTPGMIESGQLVVSICVAYRIGLDNKLHHTSNTFLITRRNGKFDRTIGSVLIDEFSIVPAGFSPAFAD